MRELKSRAHSFGQNCYHLIWSPKYRLRFLGSPIINTVCQGVLRMIAMQNGFIIHEMKVLPDHLHLFIEIPPSVSISNAFQLLKGTSSRILRRNFRWLRNFKCMWSKGKFYRSVGNVTKDVIENYIARSQGTWNYFDMKKLYRIEDQMNLKAYSA